jgi:hypothetical protein
MAALEKISVDDLMITLDTLHLISDHMHEMSPFVKDDDEKNYAITSCTLTLAISYCVQMAKHLTDGDDEYAALRKTIRGEMPIDFTFQQPPDCRH